MPELLITGGMGFLGIQAARRFLKNGMMWSPLFRCARPFTHLTLYDRHFPDAPLPDDVMHDPRVRIKTGDITLEGVPAELVGQENELAVIHLASMVSGDSELDPERAWQVNVEAQRKLIDAVGEVSPGARFLFSSSTATFGHLADTSTAPGDSTKQIPLNTYGFHKVVCELMINDATRRGAIDGRGLRLPVVVVRPGAPNPALTTCWSSCVRDPLAGRDTTLPVPAESVMPVASYQAVVEAMERLMLHLPSEEIGPDRTFTMPSLSASPRDLYEASSRFAEQHELPLGILNEAPDPLATRVINGMSDYSDGSRAYALGIPQDNSADSIVESFANDHVLQQEAAQTYDNPDTGEMPMFKGSTRRT